MKQKINFYFEEMIPIPKCGNVPSNRPIIKQFLKMLKSSKFEYNMSNVLMEDAKNIVLHTPDPDTKYENSLKNWLGNHLKEETLTLLKKGKLKILYLMPSVASHDRERNFLEWRTHHVEEFKIPEENIYYLNANLNPLPENHIGVDYWQHRYNQVIKKNRKDFTTVDEYVNQKNKKHLYLMLNRQPKWHRMSMLSRLSQEGLLEKSLYSCLAEKCRINSQGERVAFFNRDNFYVYEGMFTKNRDLSYFENFLSEYKPKKIDHDYEQSESLKENDYSKDLYCNTYFSLVTESLVELRETSLLLTRNTYRTIAHGHPFVLYAQRHALEYLKSEGYETFPELIDESYDKRKGPLERREYIINAISEVASKDKKELDAIVADIAPKLKHNQDRLFGRDFKQKYEELFEKID